MSVWLLAVPEYGEFMSCSQFPKDEYPPEGGFCTVKEFGEMCDVTPQRVYQMIKSGMVGSVKVGGRTMIHLTGRGRFVLEGIKRGQREQEEHKREQRKCRKPKR